jgi:diguanylate cyclase (GGDEF)-like protein/PAS domain S-box-containing protein
LAVVGAYLLVAAATWLVYFNGAIKAAFPLDPARQADLQRWAPAVFAAVTTGFLYLVVARVLTISKHSELELTESERALSNMFTNLPGMAYRSRNDFVRTMEFVSEGCRELTGYAPSDLVDNRKVDYSRLVHPHDQNEVWAAIQEALSNHRRYRLTYRIVTADGEERWVLEQGSGVDPVDGHYTRIEGLCTDVTKQKRYEQELVEHRNNLERNVAERTRELRETNEKLVEENEARRKLEMKLRELSTRDALTGLYNRREMERFLKDELARCQRYERPLSVVMLDLDHFKRINDSHGHPAGDEVLRWFAGKIRSGMRNTDRAVRYGGEEIAIILPETEGRDAFTMAERLRKDICKELVDVSSVEDGLEIPVTVSVGVAAFPGDARTEEALLAAADQALYRAKRGGRNRTIRAGA